MDLLLIAAGALFALLFILRAFVLALGRHIRPGFIDLLLGFLMALVPLVGLVMAGNQAQPPPFPFQVALALAGILGGLSLLVLLLELRRPERLKQSRGVFGLGVAALLAVISLMIPSLSQQVLLPVLATPTPVDVAALALTPRPTALPTRTPPPTFTPLPTATPLPAQSPTPTATRVVLMTRTPTPTATLPTPCLALTLFNVNVRAEPSLESETLRTVDFDTTVPLFGQDRTGEWWFGEIDGEAGWLKGEFLQLSRTCADLPVRG